MVFYHSCRNTRDTTIPQPLILYMLTSSCSLIISNHCKNKLLWGGVRAELCCKSKYKHLEGSWILYKFNQIAVVSSPLRSTNSPAPCSWWTLEYQSYVSSSWVSLKFNQAPIGYLQDISAMCWHILRGQLILLIAEFTARFDSFTTSVPWLLAQHLTPRTMATRDNVCRSAPAWVLQVLLLKCVVSSAIWSCP